MLTSVLRALIVIAALSAHFAPAPAHAAPGRGGSPAGTVKVEGIVVALNPAAGQISIRLFNGTIVNLQINAATRVERNGMRTTLAAFRIGDRGQAVLVNNVVIKLEARGS